MNLHLRSSKCVTAPLEESMDTAAHITCIILRVTSDECRGYDFMSVCQAWSRWLSVLPMGCNTMRNGLVGNRASSEEELQIIHWYVLRHVSALSAGHNTTESDPDRADRTTLCLWPNHLVHLSPLVVRESSVDHNLCKPTWDFNSQSSLMDCYSTDTRLHKFGKELI